MSRAIFKMRSNNAVAILREELGRTSSVPGGSVTFSGVDVGSGGNRTIIVGVTVEKIGNDNGASTTMTVGGISCPQRVARIHDFDGDSVHCAIYSVALTSQIGDVDIVIQGALGPDSWGMTAAIIRNLTSPVPTDTAVHGLETSSNITTATTLVGEAGGFVFGVVSHGTPAAATWSSLMTERADANTGGAEDDHNHSVGYDLIPAGRSASVETVAGGSASRVVIATAAFR